MVKVNKSKNNDQNFKTVSINNLSHFYGKNENKKQVLNDVNLNIDKGELVLLKGPSGCGKTTFAKTIVKMLPEGSIQEGGIKVYGEDITKINIEKIQLFRRNNFGFIYQDSIKKLNPLMRVGDHLYEI